MAGGHPKLAELGSVRHTIFQDAQYRSYRVMEAYAKVLEAC